MAKVIGSIGKETCLRGKSNSFLGRWTSNVVYSCASPTTCYAPSQLIIEWSVATASSLEYSTMSDYDDQRSIATTRSPIRTSIVSIVLEYNFLSLLYINFTIIAYPIQVRCIDNNSFIKGNLRETTKTLIYHTQTVTKQRQHLTCMLY